MSTMVDTNVDYIAALAHRRHGDAQRLGRVTYQPEPRKVGRIAGKMVRHFLGSAPGDDASHRVRIAEAAGHFIHAMTLYGFRFEDVATACEPSVAFILSSISADGRVPESRAYEGLQCALGHADPISQVVKLAEIYATAQTIIESLPDEEIAVHRERCVNWLIHASLLLEALGRLKAESRMSRLMAQTRDLVIRAMDRVTPEAVKLANVKVTARRQT